MNAHREHGRAGVRRQRLGWLPALQAALLAALAAAALISAAGVFAQGGGGVSLIYDPDEAAIWHGEDSADAEAWDGTFTDPGAVLYHDGLFHMFRNGFRQWPGWVGIAYHTSEDGLTWTAASDGPVLTTDDVPYADVAALASSVLVEEDGTWVLYFYTWGNRTSDAESWAIGRATAADPLGPWTVDAAPVLMQGEPGSWDESQVSVPSVVRTGDGYMMYFSGNNRDNLSQIGLATSADGITWTRQAEPVLTPGETGAWDAAFVQQPRVVVTPDGWVMSYRSAGAAGRSAGYGLALSQDGLHWERHAANPFLFDREIQRRGMWFNALAYQPEQEALYHFFEMQRGYQNQTDIYASVIEGSPFE